MTPPSSPAEVVLVAMVAANGVIGDGQDQPWHLREDQRRFRALTMGHPLVMGRRTWDAIGRPLSGRSTVVLTRDAAWSAPGVAVAHSMTDALRVAGGLPGGDQVMVIGGGTIYASALQYATRVELTEVDADASGSVVFPTLDEDTWLESTREDRLAFAFVTYERR